MNRSPSTYSPTISNLALIGAEISMDFTGNDPRMGWRIPLNEIKYNEQRDDETGYGYFGARYMDHELMTMWLSVDPLADKYPSISPYAYCAWNPVKLVDPDGRDFEKIIDHENKTITIRAQFYTRGTEKQNEYLQKAIDEWNSCSFMIAIPGEQDGVTEQYKVCFNLINSKENTGAPVNSVSFLTDENFNELYPQNTGAGGITENGRKIFMRNSSSNNQLLAHEIGHCLGMGDHELSNDCLMFGSNSNVGNCSVAKLGYVERKDLLSACGFSFKGNNRPDRGSQCIRTSEIGNAPNGFGTVVLTDKSFISNDTKKFKK